MTEVRATEPKGPDRSGEADPTFETVQVLIVGAGPIGLLCANLLRLYGVKALVVEQNPATSTIPKAIMIDDEFYRVLQRLDLAETLKKQMFCQVGIHFLSVLKLGRTDPGAPRPEGLRLARVDGIITSNGTPARSAFSQPLLEKALLEPVRNDPLVSVRFAHRLTQFQQHADHVLAEIASEAGPGLRVKADFILGCDGAHSTVRRQLGIELEGTTADDQPHIVLDLAKDPDQSPYSRFYCNPRRPMNSIPAPFGGRRIEFMLRRDENRDAMLEEANLRRLLAPYRDPDRVQIVRKAAYTFHARLARKLSQGRAFLLGDAAHLMPPFGAQGMNAGGRDAANLCWKLASVVRGQLPAQALDSYETERRPHVAAVIRISVRIGRLTNITSRPLALVRDLAFLGASLLPPVRRYFREMRYLPAAALGDGLLQARRVRGTGFVGRMLPQPLVTDGVQPWSPLDEWLGPGFACILVAPKRRDAWLPALRLAGALEAPLIEIQPAGMADPTSHTGIATLEVRDQRFAPVFQAHADQLLLVRPDRYVFGACLHGQLEPFSAEALQTLNPGALSPQWVASAQAA